MPNTKKPITLSTIKGLSAADDDYKVWDKTVAGFGVKVTPKGKKVYFLKYRFGRRQRWYTIGTHGAPWTPETARDEAIRLLGQVKSGIDPATAKEKFNDALSITELCDLYIKEGCPNKKASTLYADKSRIERHIKPLLGSHTVNSLTKIDVHRFMQDVANGKTALDIKNDRPKSRSIVTGGKGIATRTVGLLGGIMSYAMALGLRTDNPVWGVERYHDKKNERYLTDIRPTPSPALS